MLTDEQIDIAANYWADVLAKPLFDNGDGTMTGHMTMMLATLATTTLSQKDLQVFKEIFKKTLKTCSKNIDLSCDYQPSVYLANILTEANISLNNCPWKTNMIFKEDKVLVSYGHSQPFIEVKNN